MASNPEFLGCYEERKQESFFKVLNSVDISSENMWIPTAANDYMPRMKKMLKIDHPDGKKSWDVVFVVTRRGLVFSGGWRRLCKEYPIVLGDTCKFTFIKPHELLLLVSKP